MFFLCFFSICLLCCLYVCFCFRRPSPERGAIEFISNSNAPAGQEVSVPVASTSNAPVGQVVSVPVATDDFIIIAPEATDVAGGEVVGNTDEFYIVPAPEPAASIVTAPAPVVAPAGDDDSDITEVRPSIFSAPTASTSKRSVIAMNDDHFAETVTSWMTDFFDSEDEDLLDIDSNDVDLGISLSTQSNTRTATDCAADDDGLTTEQISLLHAQEEADDICVRDLAPTNDFFEFNWTCDRQTFTGKREVFTGSPGPTFTVTNDMTPTDIFYKMFDTDFVDMLIRQTNLYGEQKLTKLKQNRETKKHTRTLRWTPTDRDEVIAFLALIILQGLYPKVTEESYFSYDGFGTTPFFGRIMSYNRYFLLKTMLHFVDNDSTEDTTKLNKIRPVIDYFNAKFSSMYYPGQNVAIDESLLKWHGRLSISQKIATKAAQVGVKTYEMCESSSGYLWQFRVYTGKDGPNRKRKMRQSDDHNTQQQTEDQDTQQERLDNSDSQTHRPEDRVIQQDQANDPDTQQDRHDDQSSSTFRPRNATSQIVYDLMTPLLHRGHTLIMDNFYNAPLLARCLKQEKTDVFGTLRLSREFVPESLKTIKKTDMRQGEIVASYCSDLSVMLWRDSNLVSMISTYHPLLIGSVTTYNRTQVHKPAVVLDYNKSMGGVDRKDQYLASQALERQKTKVWYKKLFRRLYNAAIFNCFVIYDSNPTHKLDHRQFRRTLAEDLLRLHKNIDLTTEPKLIRHRETTQLVARQTTRPYVASNHFPMKTGSTATRCFMCTKNKRPSRTAYKCEECDVNLCIVYCFKAYHKPPRTSTTNQDNTDD
ncbi:piggyBac transposable element-derived protein 4-like isoform X1 [Pectinophora gossypiella]|uniref:piggyBac transposable element-derived protein 4-like isoform X1 n=1 Tax=Pectinophora gossypiella TaxID=13191 RepID=UPI00214F3787|nr:piggyBac transposable element-derived protein 4-like isoform X1 [Pectinophora gossypiella]XP_049870489.1 piggyBac transposable element-derived protein 4-like isoform X1 [Pectinophora gossypiella]XP_049870490.1 piggyBac transposable element-derived protein 4-like isoform X1 [Pectinophora gossypiella]XP_049870491.1 piggyBac transposable element-derived protein 4-like isoform X1 [Pectinophora gossypiella]